MSELTLKQAKEILLKAYPDDRDNLFEHCARMANRPDRLWTARDSVWKDAALSILQEAEESVTDPVDVDQYLNEQYRNACGERNGL